MEYRIKVRCSTNTVPSQTGTFLADMDHNAVSPIFDSLAELFPWMRQNGFKSEEHIGSQFVPWRAVKTPPADVLTMEDVYSMRRAIHHAR